MALSIPLALLSSLLFAVSAALQQHAARSTALRRTAGRANGRSPRTGEHRSRDDRRPAPGLLRLLARLSHHPLWLSGWALGVSGFAAQAMALHLGSIVVVQALVVTQLLFALPLGAARTAGRPLLRDWCGAITICAGLILLVVVRGGVPQTPGRRSGMWSVAVVAAALVALLLVAARLLRSHAQARTAALATAAGLCFCATAVLLVFTGEDVARDGLLAGAVGAPSIGLAVSTVLGTVLVQAAFAGGSLPTAMTAMTVTDPVASWVAGMAIFDARPLTHPAVLAGSALAVVLLAAGVTSLATSPTLHDEPRGLPRA